MSSGRRLAGSALLAWLIAGQLLVARPAEAQPKTGDDDATRAYVTGRKLLEQRKFADALAELESSMKALPSPNTELLIGHALRELGRRGEAADVYNHVIDTAGARVREGEVRFRATLEEAGRWLAVLRTDLGEISVVVPHAPKDTVITVDEREVATTASGEDVVAHAWSEQGARQIAARAPAGGRGAATVTVTAGATARVEVRLVSAAASTSPDPPATGPAQQPPPEEPSPWSRPPPLPVWIAAGAGVAGFAVFGIFGAMSSSKAGDLDECSPRCAASKRDDADAGRRDQTIANVGLVVGGVGLATAAVLWFVLPSDTPSDAPTEAARAVARPHVARVGVRPGGVVAIGRF